MSLVHGRSVSPDVERLKSSGDVGGLVTALDDRQDTAIRTAALQALVEMGRARDAVEILKQTGSVWAVQPLIRLLSDTDTTVRQGAVQALGRIGPPAVEPLVVVLADDNTREARQAIARALGQIGDLRALESLRAARKFGQKDLRRAAAEALAQLDRRDQKRKARAQADTEFLRRLEAEAYHHKTKQTSLVLQKLAFVAALFGIVVLRAPSAAATPTSVLDDFYWLLYALPFVALAYDVYICAQDYKVKRIGAFLRTSDTVSPVEREWQVYVNNRRDPLAAWASVFLTGLTIAVPALVLPFVLERRAGTWFYVWLASTVASLILVVVYYQVVLLRKLQSPAVDESLQLSAQ